jgi:RNA polymerase sigma factor (sigma-70 family)
MTVNDQELLRQYAQETSEEAFAALVNRHLNLVYSAALRQVRSPQLAEEVAQSVFTDLSRNASKLKPNTILTAWLYQVTRRTAIDVVRREARRQMRERIAVEMTDMNSNASEWTQVEPLLDEAMESLDDTDRAAVLLRYFENKSLREVGQTLGTGEDAAQKRVSRAVDRLREFFAKRGVAVGAGGLAAVISANGVQAAPAGLAATISTAAALTGTTITATATATTIKTIVMTTLQKTLIAATLTAAVGVAIYKTHEAASLRDQLEIQQDQQEKSANGSVKSAGTNQNDERARELEAENAALASSLAKAKADNTQLEADRQEAERRASIFKELAEQTSPTNKFPTHRHVVAGLGKFIAEATKLSDDKDLSADQQKDGKIALIGYVTQVIQAGMQLKQQGQPGLEDGTNQVDDKTCILYGALDLNEQQFGQTYGIIQKFHSQAEQEDLLAGTLSPESEAKLAQVNENAKNEMQQILSPGQANLLQSIVNNTNNNNHFSIVGGKNAFFMSDD